MKRIAAAIMVIFVLFLTLNLIKTDNNVCISGNRDFILNLKAESGENATITVELINVGAKSHNISSDCLVEVLIHNQNKLWRTAECSEVVQDYSNAVYTREYIFGEGTGYLGEESPSAGAYTVNAIFSYLNGDGTQAKDLICSLNFNLV